ncbi:hypothetical protein FXV77_07930 [Sphingobacterium phlebotomi]|uniref:Uncharacterized protein n=1 Tax=Sphingobacterium phlebotomi TaxID=2605433 RepID=A0A5D4HB93_9SPHI|nr:hypothetical protein [Sphingobacterium phlebotomi]TYR37089.1 hypothetical protein FXV77_07930 [Sphingobacterium phlebotomi]
MPRETFSGITFEKASNYWMKSGASSPMETWHNNRISTTTLSKSLKNSIPNGFAKKFAGNINL